MKASQLFPAILQKQPTGYIPSGVDPVPPDPPDPPANAPVRGAKEFLYLPEHRPAAAGDCVFWFLKSSGKNNLANDFPALYPGDPSKYLVLVGPVGGLTGTVTARNIRYKGVYAIGLHFNGLVGEKSLYTPAGQTVLGSFFMYITFEGGSWYTTNPFMWASNILGESACKSGDFLRWGTANLTASTPSTSKSRSDLFFQKILIPEGKGHYFFDQRPKPGEPPLSANEENWPHADTIQADGSYRNMRVADCDMAWNGQSYFSNFDGDGWPPYRPSGNLFIRNVCHRPMPQALDIYPGGANDDPGWGVPIYLTWHPSSNVVANLYTPGIFIPIDHADVYLIKYGGRKTIQQHCSPAPSGYNASTGALTWPTTTYLRDGVATVPIVGTAWAKEPAKPCVSIDQVGDYYRTPDYPALRDFFGWAS